MTKEIEIPYNENTTMDKDKAGSIIRDVKSLFKGPVLIANALPVFVGFWLALHFTGELYLRTAGCFGSPLLVAQF
ncbi:hypothetical protein QNH10_10520 [Sporosarcina thermotolerans]|uniref:hypothetical protein n=1 Tax=Sporosarcina thermotolerans TaxID=633404 RepID=UPI0024BD1057|nr:hypothetical protein [Sporosarcina thermotolerans]WHT46821.1 hypothetical protein QNH10_10520 [Sporosarcina thermotolerans]